MKGILGEKLGMMQIWNENVQVGVTAVKAGPCPVIQVKGEKEKYNAVQIGFGPVKEKHISLAERGHQKKAFEKTGQYYGTTAELRDFQEEKAIGDTITCEIFAAGDRIVARGISKGKGFQGVMKRHGFGGGKASHGSVFHRAPGSVGSGTDPGRILPGKRLPGRMGSQQVSTKNLEIVKILPEENIILVKGSIPGPRGSRVLLYQL